MQINETEYEKIMKALDRSTNELREAKTMLHNLKFGLQQYHQTTGELWKQLAK